MTLKFELVGAHIVGTMPYSEDPVAPSQTIIEQPIPRVSKKVGGRIILGMIGIWICVICIGLMLLV